MNSRTRTSSRSLETLFRLGNLGNVDDGQLLERFRTCSDAQGAEAFRVLVDRYGPIVMGVCRGVLGDENHADDAFQATFLVLVRKAGSIRNRQSIGPWLHGVAVRVARRARARAARRNALERPLDGEVSSALAMGQCEPEEWTGVVHEEIDRLPENLRSPVVLCCLEELSYEQAARQLGVNEPTLRGRLHRGRQRLEARLRARGLSVGAILPLGTPATRLLTPVSHALVEATVQLASKWFTVGALVIGAGSPTIHLLAQGVIRTMVWHSIKIAAIPVVVAASVLGTAVLAQQGRDARLAPGGSIPQVAPSKGSEQLPSPDTKQSGELKLKRDYDQEKLWEERIKEQIRIALLSDEALKQQQLQKKTEHIRELLARKSDLAFPKGISLEQFLKTVKSTTSSKNDPGIPIYVDPLGLQQSGQTLESIVVVEPGRPLAVVLERALIVLNLGYDVHEGFLTISSRLGIVESKLMRVEEKLDRVMNALENKGARP